jgi:membrane protein
MSLTRLWGLLKETANDWLKDNVSRMGAALAYYSVFSVAPLLLVAISIAGVFFGEQAARKELHHRIADAVGPPVAVAVEDILSEVHENGNSVTGGIIGLAILLFGASGVFAELQDALNAIWKVESKPGSGPWGVVYHRLISFTVVLGTGFLLLVSLAIAALLAGVQNALRQQMPGGDWLWWTVDLLASVCVVAGLFALIYKTLPNTQVRWRDVWLGSVLAALLFTLGKYLIGLYLAKGAVASAFGAAGSVIVLLVWVYYSSQIALFGAEFCHVYARSQGDIHLPERDDSARASDAEFGPSCPPSSQPPDGADHRARHPAR